MTEVKSKLLARHMENMKAVLLKYSNFIISDAKHPVNLGSAREGLISNFLSQTLPDNIQYHTGEIFDSFDEHSGQVDIIIHPIGSPKINLFGSINIFPFETVLGAIEVKSSINTDKKKPFDTFFISEEVCNLIDSSLPESLTKLIAKEFYSKDDIINEIEKQINAKLDLQLTKKIKRILNKSKLPKSASALFGALTSCELVKKLKHYSGDSYSDNIPFILFSYSSDSSDGNFIIQKVQDWINFKIQFEKKSINEICKNLPDMIIILDKSICFKKVNREWRMAGLTLENLYKIGDENVLFELFSYLTHLTEKWSSNQSSHFFPAKYYLKDVRESNNEFF